MSGVHSWRRKWLALSLEWLVLTLVGASSGCGDDASGTNKVSLGPSDGGGLGTAGRASARGSATASAHGSPELPSGVSGATPLLALGDSDLVDVCEALGARLGNVVSDAEAERLACTSLALFVSVEPADGGQGTVNADACNRSVDDCLTLGLERGMRSTDCDLESLTAATRECSATVAEYEACVDAQAEFVVRLVDALNCDTLASPTVAKVMAGGDALDSATLSECRPIAAACPELLTDMGRSGGGTGGSPSSAPAVDGCDDTCLFAGDNECDDGGGGSNTDFCGLGSDCADCGQR